MIAPFNNTTENKGKRQNHCIWKPAQRAEIGKHAAEHGNASTVGAMGLKYHELKRQTVSDIKLAYHKLKKSKEAADSNITWDCKEKIRSPHVATRKLDEKRNWNCYKWAA